MANEGFLGRWARLKRDTDAAGGSDRERPVGAARTQAVAKSAAVPGTAPVAGPAAGTALSTAEGASASAAPDEYAERSPGENPDDPGPGKPVQLPSIDSLTKDSDFSMFMRADVDPGVRVSALKKLFSDPHFNRMDGLDVYIDDYNKPDPMPLAFLKQLNQARILGLADDEEAQAQAGAPAPEASPPSDGPETASADAGGAGVSEAESGGAGAASAGEPGAVAEAAGNPGPAAGPRSMPEPDPSGRPAGAASAAAGALPVVSPSASERLAS